MTIVIFFEIERKAFRRFVMEKYNLITHLIRKCVIKPILCIDPRKDMVFIFRKLPSQEILVESFIPSNSFSDALRFDSLFFRFVENLKKRLQPIFLIVFDDILFE